MLDYIDLISPIPPAPFILFNVFQKFFCAKNISWYINAKQQENINKEEEESFFSCYVVQVGEFMKLSFACVGIVSKVLLVIEDHQ